MQDFLHKCVILVDDQGLEAGCHSQNEAKMSKKHAKSARFDYGTRLRVPDRPPAKKTYFMYVFFVFFLWYKALVATRDLYQFYFIKEYSPLLKIEIKSWLVFISRWVQIPPFAKCIGL